MILTALLMSLHHVCCFSAYGQWIVVALTDGHVQIYGQGNALVASFKLPRAPSCLAGPYAVVPENEGISIYYIKIPRPVKLRDVWFEPSYCHANERLIALVAQEDNTSVILDLANNTTYVIPQSTLVKVYKNVIVIVRGNSVEVHNLLGGFSISFKSRVNDVTLDNNLYVCTDDGLYAVYSRDEVKLVSRRGCDIVDARGELLAFSQRSKLFVYNGTRSVQTFDFKMGIKSLKVLTNNKVFVLSGDTLFGYIIISIDDKVLAIMLGAPLLVAVTDFLRKVIQLRD